MAGHQHIALDLADGVGDAQQHRLQVVGNRRAAGREQLVAADGHHRAVRRVFHGDPSGLDVLREEPGQTRALDQLGLLRWPVDGLHRDLAQGMDVPEHRLGIGGQLQAQAEQEQQQQRGAHGDPDPGRQVAGEPVAGHRQPPPMR
ncbi:hypothetical protein D9M70_538690 [compost metagenome]